MLYLWGIIVYNIWYFIPIFEWSQGIWPFRRWSTTFCCSQRVLQCMIKHWEIPVSQPLSMSFFMVWSPKKHGGLVTGYSWLLHHAGDCHKLTAMHLRLEHWSHAIVCQINAPWTEIGGWPAEGEKLIIFCAKQAVQYRNRQKKIQSQSRALRSWFPAVPKGERMGRRGSLGAGMWRGRVHGWRCWQANIRLFESDCGIQESDFQRTVRYHYMTTYLIIFPFFSLLNIPILRHSDDSF